MNISTILCPTDFSPLSYEALSLATSLARDNNARLLIAHVMERPAAAGAMAAHAGVPVPSAAELSEKLKNVVPSDLQVSYDHRLAEGPPGDGIVELAERENADLIVMATHGRSGMSRLLMGSVAECVVRKAPCPVLTVKQPNGNTS